MNTDRFRAKLISYLLLASLLSTLGLVSGAPLLAATLSGTPDPRVQWQESSDGVKFDNIHGATTPTYSFTPKPDDNGK